jgi:arylsulfatase A-like enzyme
MAGSSEPFWIPAVKSSNVGCAQWRSTSMRGETPSQAKPSQAKMTRPNFLLFITDQHRVDYLSCYGHPVLKTPHIDSIAARGARFENFYVATPVCMPNRATLMTGRMPSAHGGRGNGIPLPLNSNTFVDALRAGGYATALVGKSHLQNFTGFPPIQKRAEPRDGDTVLDAEFAEATKPIVDDGPYDQELPARGLRAATSQCSCRSTASSMSTCAPTTVTASVGIITSG